MKKLFISCPMKGRTEENIRKSMEKMHKIAEIVFGEELEVIPSYIEDEPPENVVNRGIWYLGKSILMIAEADFFIGVDYSDVFKGCNVERNIAEEYNIPIMCVRMQELMPDAAKVERAFWNRSEESCAPMRL